MSLGNVGKLGALNLICNLYVYVNQFVVKYKEKYCLK